jgi:hypothetical protein
VSRGIDHKIWWWVADHCANNVSRVAVLSTMPGRDVGILGAFYMKMINFYPSLRGDPL